jgi:predicted ATPase
MAAALTLAEKLGHAHTLAFALTFTASMRNNRRDFSMAFRYAEAAYRLAAKHDLPLWLGESTIAKAFAEASLGHHSEAIPKLRSGITSLEEIGDWHHRSQWFGLLATAHLEIHDYDNARDALEKALDAVRKTSECYFMPELERLRGTVMLHTGNPVQAETCFQEAVSLAKKMGARSFELRAAASLARLLSAQGRSDEAYGSLAGIYGWFSEGFDAVDLKEAKALMDELAPSSRCSPDTAADGNCGWPADTSLA